MTTYSFFPNKDCAKDDTADNNKLNNKAHQKPSILMPSINLSASKIMSAFITNKNNPSVIMVMGNVSITKIGLMKVFSKARTNANTSAVVNWGM